MQRSNKKTALCLGLLLAVGHAPGAVAELPDDVLKEQAVKTCTGIRDGVLRLSGIGRESEGNQNIGGAANANIFKRGLVAQLPNSFNDPEMKRLMEQVTDRYKKTGRLDDLERSAMNQELFLVPCAQIQIQKFRSMTQNMMGQNRGQSGNAVSQPGMQTSEPSEYNAPNQMRTPNRRERQQSMDYGTSRR
jgi:hypothetical protein